MAIILITLAVALALGVALGGHVLYQNFKHLTCSNCNSYNGHDSSRCEVCGCMIIRDGQLKLDSSRN